MIRHIKNNLEFIKTVSVILFFLVFGFLFSPVITSAADYQENCEVGGSCSCGSGWCSSDSDCVYDDFCYAYCPSSEANSHLVSSSCSVSWSGCSCSWWWSGCSGSCSCVASGQCEYECDSGYTWDGSQCVEENQPPDSDFTYSPSYPDTSDTVDFTDQSSDPDGSIQSWAWDFGDGATSYSQNPSHSYTSSGDYAVELIVTDDDGAWDGKTKTVSVTESNQPPKKPTNPSPPDEKTGVSTDLTLNVTVSDPDGDNMVVRFYGAKESKTYESDSEIIGEAGINTNMHDDNWYSVSLSNSYGSTPYIFSTTQTTNGGQDPSAAHIRSVSSSKFETQHCEFDASDTCDTHNAEDQAWLAVDPSTISDIDGIDAGTLSTSSGSGGYSITFDSSIENTPLLFTNVQTENDNEDPLNTQAYNINSNGATVEFCEQDSTDGCDSHTSETIAWLAIDTSKIERKSGFDYGTFSTGNSNWQDISFSQSFSSAPAVIADVQTENGGQEALYPEVDNVGTGSAYIRYCESEGGNSCDSHATETVAWMAVEPGKLKLDTKSQSKELIGSDEVSGGSGTAEVDWTGLNNGTTYLWHAEADDGTDKTQSDTWNFTTNTPPDQPSVNYPPDGSTRIETDPTLNVTVSDPDGDTMNVSFYDGYEKWQYKRPININENSGSDLSNYQVKVVVNTSTLIDEGKMNSDCSDIRFTDSDGSTQLDYWIEGGCNTGSTEIWIKVPLIPASSTKTIYMYYGDPTASSESNSDSVLNDLTSIPTDDALIDGRDGPDNNNGDGEKMGATETKDASLLKFDISQNYTTTTISDVVLYTYVYDHWYSSKRKMDLWGVGNEWHEGTVTWNTDRPPSETNVLVNDVDQSIPSWWTYSSDSLTDYFKKKAGNNISLAVDYGGAGLYDKTSSLHYGIEFYSKEETESADYKPYLDLMDVRKYASPEPSVSVGSEEEVKNLIATDTDVASGSTSTVTWSGLSEETAYSWYAVADDGLETTKSDIWSFETGTISVPRCSVKICIEETCDFMTAECL